MSTILLYLVALVKATRIGYKHFLGIQTTLGRRRAPRRRWNVPLADGKRVNFSLVDRLISLTPAQAITMTKHVSMAEEYLADHFPGFPVLPGVLMLEAAVQAAAWLVREWENFAHSLIVLREARQIRYGAFVQPGQALTIQAEVLRLEPAGSEFKIRGGAGEAIAIQGRIELAHRNLSEHDPTLAALDKMMTDAALARWKQLRAAQQYAV